MFDVAVAKCKSYEYSECRSALEEVLSKTDGINKITFGKKVVIKVNLVSAMKPEKAATTHPVLLCALIDILREKGADIIVGDSPGGIYNAAHLNHVYSVTGMRSAEEHGAKLNDDFSEAKAEFPQAKTAKEFYYTAYLDKADYIIDFCKLKTHGMMGMSAGVKNMFGVVPGIVKPEYHYKYPNVADFASMIVDLNEYFKPILTICDAITGMEGNGPTAGTPRDIGAVMASDSPYKLDTVCAKLIGLTKDDIPILEEAFNRGYTTATADELNIYGETDSLVIRDYKKLPVNKSHAFESDSDNVFGRLIGKLIKIFLEARPKVRKNECVGCKECFRVCPAKAITMQNDKPVIDRKKCIKCFCCQEFCPKGAMKVNRTIIAKIFSKDK